MDETDVGMARIRNGHSENDIDKRRVSDSRLFAPYFIYVFDL